MNFLLFDRLNFVDLILRDIFHKNDAYIEN